jgi:flagellar basal-body rod protein FlgB
MAKSASLVPDFPRKKGLAHRLLRELREPRVMIDALFNQSSYIAAKKMLDVNLMRHEAIASNLGNIETPNYKRLDVAPAFETQLQQAINGGDIEQISSLQPQLGIDTQTRSSRSDGNTVQLESELLKMNQNTTENAVETQMVNWSLARMRMAITGNP